MCVVHVKNIFSYTKGNKYHMTAFTEYPQSPGVTER